MSRVVGCWRALDLHSKKWGVGVHSTSMPRTVGCWRAFDLHSEKPQRSLLMLELIRLTSEKWSQTCSKKESVVNEHVCVCCKVA